MKYNQGPDAFYFTLIVFIMLRPLTKIVNYLTSNTQTYSTSLEKVAAIGSLEKLALTAF